MDQETQRNLKSSRDVISPGAERCCPLPSSVRMFSTKGVRKEGWNSGLVLDSPASSPLSSRTGDSFQGAECTAGKAPSLCRADV